MSSKRTGKLKRAIFSALLAGVALGLSRSPKQQWKIIHEDLPKEFARFKMQNLEYGLHRLYKDKYIDIHKDKSGYFVPHLTTEGKKLATFLKMDNIIIEKNEKWDNKFRLVIFDIPEKRKKHRDILRFHIKRLGFVEIQKSVFCFPHECAKEIMEVVNTLYLTKQVKYIVADEISNDTELKKHFGLH